MVSRRSFFGFLAGIPLLSFFFRKETKEQDVSIPPEAKARIIEVLSKGGSIGSISFALPAPKGRCAGGQIFFTKEAERAWKIV
jgi:hypothetical protein